MCVGTCINIRIHYNMFAYSFILYIYIYVYLNNRAPSRHAMQTPQAPDLQLQGNASSSSRAAPRKRTLSRRRADSELQLNSVLEQLTAQPAVSSGTVSAGCGASTLSLASSNSNGGLPSIS